MWRVEHVLHNSLRHGHGDGKRACHDVFNLQRALEEKPSKFKIYHLHHVGDGLCDPDISPVYSLFLLNLDNITALCDTCRLFRTRFFLHTFELLLHAIDKKEASRVSPDASSKPGVYAGNGKYGRNCEHINGIYMPRLT